jgi:hypothetical protein
MPQEERRTQETPVPLQPHAAIECIGLFGSADARSARNAANTHEATPNAADFVLNAEGPHIGYAKVVDHGKLGVSGYSLKEDAQVVSTFSVPLETQDVRFLRCRARSWEFVSGASGLFNPLMHAEGETIVPLVGGIFLNGRDITKDEGQMERLGLSIVKDKGGNDVTIPAFLIGGRSIMWPSNAKVPVFKTPEGGHKCLKYDELKELMTQKLGGPNEAAFQRELESRLRQRWIQGKNGQTAEEYIARNIEAAYFEAAVERLNGLESGSATMLQSVALQLKGVGIKRYVYHLNRRQADGTPILHDGDVILDTQDAEEREKLALLKDTVLCQRPEYADEAGIFLDVRYEHMFDHPIGGLHGERKAIQKGHTLWAEGAEMSEMILGSTSLIRRIEIEEVEGAPTRMVCDEVEVSLKAVFDDTNRLEVISKGPKRRNAPNADFKAMIERDYGAYSDENRDDYLRRLCSTIGKNMQKCHKNGLTIAKEQNTADNLSTKGRIKDPENFRTMQTRYQMNPLVQRWLKDAVDTAGAGGVDAVDFYLGGLYEGLATAALGVDEGKKAQAQVARLVHSQGIDIFKWWMRPEEYASLELSRRQVKARLANEKRTIDRADIHRLMMEDESFRRYAGIAGFPDKVYRDLSPESKRSVQYKIFTPYYKSGKLVEFDTESLYRHLDDACIEYMLWKDHRSFNEATKADAQRQEPLRLVKTK